MLYLLLALISIGLVSSSTPFKLVGYWENWGPTPKAEAIKNYTHIMYAFLETDSNNCNISPPSSSVVKFFKDNGKKVLGSVGGWSMNDFWKYCPVNTLVSTLVKMVNQYDLDGIDIDYEIDPPDANYVISLSNGLRSQLPGKLITHVPMNNLVDNGASYWKILSQCNGVDFISVQYYNDNPDPVTNPTSAINHYKTLVNGLYNGDATKVVFGLCISDCNSFNMNAQGAASITKELVQAFPTTFGGIMNWAENQGDINGDWSAALHQYFH